MKKLMNAALMLTLACSMTAFAQSGMSSDSSMKKSGSMTGKQKSVTGCIAEKDGKYMLMEKKHPDGIELMSSDDLRPHVGHKVRVTGMMQTIDAMSGDSMRSGDSMKTDNNMKSDDKGMKDDKMSSGDTMKHDDSGMMVMKVSSMKMKSDHCDMSK